MRPLIFLLAPELVFGAAPWGGMGGIPPAHRVQMRRSANAGREEGSPGGTDRNRAELQSTADAGREEGAGRAPADSGPMRSTSRSPSGQDEVSVLASFFGESVGRGGSGEGTRQERATARQERTTNVAGEDRGDRQPPFREKTPAASAARTSESTLFGSPRESPRLSASSQGSARDSPRLSWGSFSWNAMQSAFTSAFGRASRGSAASAAAENGRNGDDATGATQEGGNQDSAVSATVEDAYSAAVEDPYLLEPGAEDLHVQEPQEEEALEEEEGSTTDETEEDGLSERMRTTKHHTFRITHE